MFHKWRHVLHVLWVGLTLRCPACEQGRTFKGLFSVNKTCSNCGVRFEREDGESVGGMYSPLTRCTIGRTTGQDCAKCIAC